MILITTSPKAELEYPEKRPLGTEVQTLLQRTWLWFTAWQKSHCGASLMEVNRNPPPPPELAEEVS